MADHDDRLLRLCGEIVVARRHERIPSRVDHRDEATVEVSGRCVEVGHLPYGRLVGEHGAPGRPPRRAVRHLGIPMSHWNVFAARVELHNVGAVGHPASVAFVVLRIRVRTCPLEMDAVPLANLKFDGREVVRDGGEDLRDVAAPALDVEIEYASVAARAGARAPLDLKRVGAVLKGAADVRRINVELEREARRRRPGITEANEVRLGVGAAHLGVFGVVQTVDGFRIVTLFVEATPTLEVGTGDVIPDAQHARSLPVKERLADLQVERSRVVGWVVCVAEVVVPTEWRDEARGRRRAPLALLHPPASVDSLAGDSVVGSRPAVDLELLTVAVGGIKVCRVAAHA
eukprot:scaffold21698_cov122-Isochrysis_galbana.AAC.4